MSEPVRDRALGHERCGSCRRPLRAGERYDSVPTFMVNDHDALGCELRCLNCTDSPAHRCRIFRDLTAPYGHPFSWRARCTCMGNLPGDPGWKPHWAACCHRGAVGIVNRHLRNPQPDDWADLYHDPRDCQEAA